MNCLARATRLLGSFILFTTVAATSQADRFRVDIRDMESQSDRVGAPDGVRALAHKAALDTIWIADWGFDDGAPCLARGWEIVDNSILTDGQVYWEVAAGFGGLGNIAGSAAIVGNLDLCCEQVGGYANDWYQAIRIEYSGSGTIQFDYALDSETGFDFLTIEADSNCASFDRVDLEDNPAAGAATFRSALFADSGLDLEGTVLPVGIPNFGTSSTHCLFIAFFSDVAASPCDGLFTSTLGRALVVDNIELNGVDNPLTEDFEGALHPSISFVDIQENTPFGTWARLFPHATDNDLCAENTSCAWIFTDHTRPTLSNDPSTGFGPSGFVIRNWLDNSIVSPWISLAGTNAAETVIEFRIFPGNFFSQSLIASNWSVRSKQALTQTGTNDGRATDCVSEWGHVREWRSLDSFRWITVSEDMTLDFDPDADAIQIRHRVADWRRFFIALPPAPFQPGPGPYIDRTRIGRIVANGPVIRAVVDQRSQAQDAYATEIHDGISPGTGEHFRPSTDRFASAAFSSAVDLGADGSSSEIVTADSIVVEVEDVRGAGGIAQVDWYGAIVAGPHAGKAPPPFTVGANGFFHVVPDSARNQFGSVEKNRWFTDLDDDYFRGGDVLHYVWLATDVGGVTRSLPEGLTGAPTAPEQAQDATQGMFEVSFLPAIEWDPAYLSRVAADAHGKLEPTASERANSRQSSCILYYNSVNTQRRSGDVNRTSFMYALDRLGYHGTYDVYDHSGYGNTNNQLGGRATEQQAQGYSLIVYDVGRRTSLILPNGSGLDSKVDQSSWFRTWLSQVAFSEAGSGTLWIIGSNALEERPGDPLYATNLSVTLASANQTAGFNPIVFGQGEYRFTAGIGSCTADFLDDRLQLVDRDCRVFQDYDGLESAGDAVITHAYVNNETGIPTQGAIVMRTSPFEGWNMILQSHPWSELRDAQDASPSLIAVPILNKVLSCVLPVGCQRSPTATDVPGVVPLAPPPGQTQLHANAPNPFNPTTTIRFDLARAGRAELRVHDVSGRLVRTLVHGRLDTGRHAFVWDGLDDEGRRVSSGIYMIQCSAAEYSATRKIVLLK